MVSLNINKARLETKLGDYAIASATALADTTPHQRAQEYRRHAGARMVALDKDDIRTKLPESEYHVSRKIDGEFTVLIFDGKQAATINPGGTVRMGLPFINEAAEVLGKAGVKAALVAGELYVARPDGKRPRVHDVSRVARQPETKEELKSLRFAVFDLMELDGKPAPSSFAENWKRIVKTFEKGELARPVDAVFVKKVDEIEKKFEEWVEKDGEEGLVARSETAGTFKIKPRHTIDAAVVGFTEGTEDRKGMLHDLLLALMREDGTFHLFCRVGGGFTEDNRRSMFSDLKDRVVESEYAEVNPEHVAYEMVAPEWVVEISCLDLISQTTRGGSIDRMVLDWDKKQKKYGAIRRLPLVSVISPQFVRRREDKVITPSDLRMKQIADLVEVKMLDRCARQLALPKSELIKREVFTKVLKGQTMVRKLVMWKTNKEGEGSSYPAYVVHFTDFSPNRKTNLERDIRISNSREQIEALYAGLLAENVVKGWAKV
jgi:ATP-dependent DNA ligase